jgi:thiosulfate dehydrogenase [quinone] large subunit
MNPFADTFAFLTRNEWPTYVFWLLLLTSLGIALVNLLRDPAQRMGRHVWMWVARVFIGALWLQQTLWKLPPTYTDSPDGVSGGLHYWVGEMVQHSAFGIQSWLVEKVIQPHFYFFAPQVYMAEVMIAVSLLLGVFTRLGGVLGALMAMNLWLGLYRASYEWPWTYFFLIVLQITFVVLHAGKSLGLDAILVRREQTQPKPEGAAARALAYLT